MFLKSMLANLSAGVLTGVLGVVVWLFFPIKWARRRLYRRVLKKNLLEKNLLAKYLQIRRRNSSKRSALKECFRSDQVKDAFDSPIVSVLEKWMALYPELMRNELIGKRLRTGEFSGQELFEAIVAAVKNTWWLNNRLFTDETVRIAEQIDDAALDPRFSKMDRAKEWWNNIGTLAESNPEYLHDVTTKLDLYSAVKDTAALNNPEFLVVAASVTAERRNDVVTVHVVWPENPFVAYKKEQRKSLEGSKLGWPGSEAMKNFRDFKSNSMSPVLARFSAGGSLIVLNLPEKEGSEERKEYILVVQRDADAPIYPGYFAPASGLSQQEEDWSNPLLVAVGECVEEMRVCTRKPDHEGNYTWFVPQFSDRADRFALNCKIAGEFTAHKNRLEVYEREWGYAIDGRPREDVSKLIPKPCKVELFPLGTNQQLVINGRTLQGEHLLVLDPQCGAVDVMVAVIMYLDQPLSQLRVLDGEAILTKLGRKHSEMMLLWRKVYVFTPEQLQSGLSGKEAEPAAFFGREECDDGTIRWKEAWDPPDLSKLKSMSSVEPLKQAAMELLLKRWGLQVDETS